MKNLFCCFAGHNLSCILSAASHLDRFPKKFEALLNLDEKERQALSSVISQW